MAIQDDVPLTHEIRLDGQWLLSGDETSAHLIFNNLSGVNFTRTHPASSQTHAQYLSSMTAMFNEGGATPPIEFRPGAVLTVSRIGGATEVKHTFA